MAVLRQLFIRVRSATTGEWFANPQLRPAIVRDVLAQGSNLNDVAVARLAAHYGVVWEPRNRRSDPDPHDDVIALRVPPELLAKVDEAAVEHGRTRQDEALAVLSDLYGVPFERVRKRHGPKRLTPA